MKDPQSALAEVVASVAKNLGLRYLGKDKWQLGNITITLFDLGIQVHSSTGSKYTLCCLGSESEFIHKALPIVHLLAIIDGEAWEVVEDECTPDLTLYLHVCLENLCTRYQKCWNPQTHTASDVQGLAPVD